MGKDPIGIFLRRAVFQQSNMCSPVLWRITLYGNSYAIFAYKDFSARIFHPLQSNRCSGLHVYGGSVYFFPFDTIIPYFRVEDLGYMLCNLSRAILHLHIKYICGHAHMNIYSYIQVKKIKLTQANFIYANMCSMRGVGLLFHPVSTRPANAANHGSFLPLHRILSSASTAELIYI